MGETYANVIPISYSLVDLDPNMSPALQLTGPGCGSNGVYYMLSKRLTATFTLDLRARDDQDYVFGDMSAAPGIPLGCTPTGLAIYAKSAAGETLSAFVAGFTSSITSLSPATTQYVMPDPVPAYVTIDSTVHTTYSCFGARRVLPCPTGGTSRAYLYVLPGSYVDLATGDSSGLIDWVADHALSGQLGVEITYPGFPTRPSGSGLPMSIRAATTAVNDLTATATNTSITATWSPPTIWGGGTYAVSLDGGAPVTTQDLTFTARARRRR